MCPNRFVGIEINSSLDLEIFVYLAVLWKTVRTNVNMFIN